MREIVRREVRVRGVVQGVGFRPWAARIAAALDLTGEVQNTPWGVRVALEGRADSVERWLCALRDRPPDGAHVEAIDVRDVPCCGGRGFAIARSAAAPAASTRVPPDRAVCAACLDDLFDPENRRYRYPFTHCAGCGPRASILRDLPFDRERTALAPFVPCATCEREYADAADRRFHAESIACPACGPRLHAHDCAGRAIAGDAVEAAAACLREGGIVALKGYGGFHLVCDATRPDAVARLRKSKLRPTKPFALLVPDLAVARALVELRPADEAWLCGPARAVVLAPRRPGRRADALAAAAAPRSRDLGLILPVAPVHWLLLYASGTRPGEDPPRFEALIFTSANRSEAPTLHDDADARALLGELADLVLGHDRAVTRPSDDTVVRHAGDAPIPIRLSRSTTPRPIRMVHSCRERPVVLAVGGDLKAAPAVLVRGEIVLGEHVGDLAHVDAADALERRAISLCRLLGARPEVVAHDRHPDYVGTAIAERLAEQLGARRVAVQHHHAHAAACLVESGLAGPALALVLDGGGFGPEGTVWGGELLQVDFTGAQRLAHLEQVPLPGGDAAIREPWRMAWAWLRRAFPAGDAPPLPWHERRDGAALAVVARAARRGIASPLTSSCGRLFDAMASLVDLGDTASHEGELAAALECLAEECGTGAIALDPSDSSGPVIPVGPLVRHLVVQLSQGVPRHVVASAFHATLAERLAQAAFAASRATGSKHVLLSGGCLQNRVLRRELLARLGARGLEAHIHRSLPPNDGGLAVGQAAVAGSLVDARSRASSTPVSGVGSCP
jgi:hydrogenase maturation protein HypF